MRKLYFPYIFLSFLIFLTVFFRYYCYVFCARDGPVSPCPQAAPRTACSETASSHAAPRPFQTSERLLESYRKLSNNYKSNYNKLKKATKDI